jgi:CRISPR-associated protein Csm2
MPNYNRNRDREANRQPPPRKIDTKWITEPHAIDNTAVDWAEEAGKYLVGEKLTTSSLRRFFGEVRRIEGNFEKYKNDIPMLRARLAYDTGRKGKPGIEEFKDLVMPGLLAVEQDKSRFLRFIKMVEAIVAFHKANNGAQ